MAFSNPIMAAEQIIRLAFRSANFKEAISGWRITKDGQAQYENLQVINAIAAKTLSVETLDANTIMLNNADLMALLDRQRVAGWVERTTNVTLIGGVETPICEVSYGEAANRSYTILTVFNYTQTAATDTFVARLRFTTNNTAPTVTSPVLREIRMKSGLQGEVSSLRPNDAGAANVGNLAIRIGLFVLRTGGAGTCDVLGSPGGNVVRMRVYDDGPKRAQSTSSTTTTAVTLQPDKPFPSIWSRSYEETGAPKVTSNTTSLYHGNSDQFGGNNGNQRSLVGFDYPAIQSYLTGATIHSCKLVMRCQHDGASSGVDFSGGTHNSTTNPDPFPNTGIVSRRYALNDWVAGTEKTLDLGLTIAEEFKTGIAKGILVGPQVGSNIEGYGYFYGHGSSYPPRLVFSVRK